MPHNIYSEGGKTETEEIPSTNYPAHTPENYALNTFSPPFSSA